MDELNQLTAWAEGLLGQLSDGQRKQLAGQIAKELRGVNQKRIAAQVAPDGTPFAPRKTSIRDRIKKRGVRKGKMFQKLRLAKYLKANASATSAVVEFAGTAARIAAVHHHGLRDRVSRDGHMATYAARPLLGITDADANTIKDLMLAHLSRT
jgi:phage virion morphogenesis protein